MMKHTPFLLYQIARFGAVQRKEIDLLCEGKCRKTQLYESLKELYSAQLVRRLSHPLLHQPTYQITEKGFEAAFGQKENFARAVREINIHHTVRVAETLVNLARYDNVTGFATEFEVSSNEWRYFSDSRTPDGVIQIIRDGLKYELAIEVEASRKTFSETDAVIEKYKIAFAKGVQCRGVIVVCDASSTLERYQERLRKFEDQVSKRFLLVSPSGVLQLNPKLYGTLWKTPGKSPELSRNFSGGDIQYLPIKSVNGWLKTEFSPPDRGGQSPNNKNKGDMQINSQSSI